MGASMPVRAVLVDIEGTTSSISFVHDTLFPHARAAMGDFLREHAHEPAVAEQIRATAREADVSANDLEAVTAALIDWIDRDRKETPLKALQGMIWEQGYRDDVYRAHMYPDATAALRRWHAAGLPLYVYSSGSVRAQQLFFGHSVEATCSDCSPATSTPPRGASAKRSPIAASPESSTSRPRTSSFSPTSPGSWTPRAKRACRPCSWSATRPHRWTRPDRTASSAASTRSTRSRSPTEGRSGEPQERASVANTTSRVISSSISKNECSAVART